MSYPPTRKKKLVYSRSFLRSRREALLILLSWAALMVWTVGYSWHEGTDRATSELSVVFGLPKWVFWGVVVPWMAALVFSIGFALFYMEDDSPADPMRDKTDKLKEHSGRTADGSDQE